MVIFPKAKINIGLRITDKRPDGYHNLQTIFYPVDLSDALEFVVPGERLENDLFTMTGIPMVIKPEENLVMKALSKMREYCPIPFLKIHLHKMIPSGAGLGGGSSDAAAFLKILNRYFCFKLNDHELMEAALSLGSDCPFFILSQPAYAEGRGEKMTPVGRLPDGLFLIILKPETDISTADAFAGCTPNRTGTSLPDLYRMDITRWKDLISNDFEKTLLVRYPEIEAIKGSLYSIGAVFCSMTGSGSAVYGIFKGRPDIPDNLRKYLVYTGIL
ncbi:MAG: 4-(cytidine 5'-diphospho)-2-C-methyl-D-erythritol kinase [Bacteroidales bacterium]|jgi:4-diphosphocytidyl-2-C-methyl-D-erythritol kinase